MVIRMDEYKASVEKFAKWIETNETKLNTACHCTPTQSGHQSWEHVIEYHKTIQSEIEDTGQLLNQEVKQQLNDKSSQQWGEATDLEKRWHKLWIKSLEQLVIVDRTRRCPRHNSAFIGKPAPKSPANKSVSKLRRPRPISFPNNASDRLEWDYQGTMSLTGCHKEIGSQMDLDSVDEQVTKNLTEFGENYELYFGTDEVHRIPLHSRPPSCEPNHLPETAKAVVTSNSNSTDDVNRNPLTLTTTSSMFSVDATIRCVHKANKKQYVSTWIYFCSLLVSLALILFSVFNEPYQLHKSYHHSRPPV